MTETKFKYWDGEFKQMCDVRAIVWHNNMIANIELFDSKTMFRNPNMFYEHALLQFTGLKDSKGREIYEGDIVELLKQETPSSLFIRSLRITVKWSEQGLNYNIWSPAVGEKWEVIGTKYENPELLKGD